MNNEHYGAILTVNMIEILLRPAAALLQTHQVNKLLKSLESCKNISKTAESIC